MSCMRSAGRGIAPTREPLPTNEIRRRSQSIRSTRRLAVSSRRKPQCTIRRTRMRFAQILASVDQPSDLRGLEGKTRVGIMARSAHPFHPSGFFLVLKFFSSHFLSNGSSAITFCRFETNERDFAYPLFPTVVGVVRCNYNGTQPLLSGIHAQASLPFDQIK
jgi:hypothetical protein